MCGFGCLIKNLRFGTASSACRTSSISSCDSRTPSSTFASGHVWDSSDEVCGLSGFGAAQSWFARLLQHCRQSSPRSLIGLRGRCRCPTCCLALPLGRHWGASGRAPSRRTRRLSAWLSCPWNAREPSLPSSQRFSKTAARPPSRRRPGARRGSLSCIVPSAHTS